MTLKSRKWTFILALAGASASALAADDITMDIGPAFEGNVPRTGSVPVAVEFRNSGPDTQISLHVDNDEFHMIYPLELPRGASKRLITYPNLNYSGARFTAQTNRGVIIKNYEAPTNLGDSNQTVLMVSDSPGDLAFLRGTKTGSPETGQPSVVGGPPGNQQSVVQDAYVTPMLAPPRPVGYASIGAVVLGSGAERLRDEQISALKNYVLLGGTLMFVGGASAPLLNDPRWQDILPVRDFHAETLTDSTVLGDLGSTAAPTASFMTGRPVDHALAKFDHGTLITSERSYGLGRSVYIAFNPFEAPLNRWDGRRTAMMRELRAVDFIRAANFVRGYSAPTEYTSYGGGAMGYSATPYATYGSGGVSNAANDPFSIQLPPAEFIFTLLAVYFVAVVPVNFLVLKRLKRGEWAWFTAPIISLIFAAEFFARARDLYSAKMSTSSQGIVIAQEGAPNAVFVGKTQMFIPTGGSYDLKLRGVDSLNVENTEFNGPYSYNQQVPDLNAVDVGEILVPNLPANNLAFRELSYRQNIPYDDWFKVRITPDQHIVITNRSPYALANPYLLVGRRGLALEEIKSGEERSILSSALKKIPDDNDVSGGFKSFVVRDQNVMLVGSINDFLPGPKLGTPVPGRTQIKFALMAKEALPQ